MKKALLILSVILLAISLLGCKSNYRPLDAQIRTMEHAEARKRFLSALLKHLAEQRGYPFAKGYFDRSYIFAGSKQTDDGRTTIFLFENQKPLALRWAYIYLSFGDSPYMFAQENTSANARVVGSTDDGDGEFRGLFKLTVMDAAYCSGETKDLPEVEGNQVRLNTYERSLRKSMLKDMQARHTPTYCQGMDPSQERTALAGVRFYFNTREALEEFASILTGTFPRIKYTGGPEQR